MATTTYTTIFKFKRGQAEAWTRVNPILAEAEPGYELDTGKLKIGDGATAWNDLAYFGGSASLSEDGKSLSISSGKLTLYGFDAAETGQIPVKNENGTLSWVDKDIPLTEDEILAILV